MLRKSLEHVAKTQSETLRSHASVRSNIQPKRNCVNLIERNNFRESFFWSCMCTVQYIQMLYLLYACAPRVSSVNKICQKFRRV